MFTAIVAGLGLAGVLFLLYVAAQSNEFRVSRSAVLPAGPLQVFGLLNDFHQWDHWSPWAKLDPNSRVTFDGAESGVGAKFAWDGNNKVGAGSMEILEARPGEHLRLRLTFLRPMVAENLTVFTLSPEGSGTKLTWTMTGPQNFMGKLFNTLINCEKMVGKDFEKGLANMHETLAASAA